MKLIKPADATPESPLANVVGAWSLPSTQARIPSFNWFDAHTSLFANDPRGPKLVADQLGHGLGVNLDVYMISDLGQCLESVNLLEQSLVSTAIN